MKKIMENTKGFVIDIALLAVSLLWLWRLRFLRREELASIHGLLSIAVPCAFGALLAVVLFALHAARLKEWPMERLFLLAYVPISIAMMCLLPIGRVPDEPAHLQRVYAIATGHFLPGDNTVEMPVELVRWGEQDPTVYSLSKMLADAAGKPSGERVTSGLGENTGIYPINSYFPQALGLAIARLFTSNWVIQLYAARLGGWLATLILLYYAIRIAPAGKEMIALAALFPMCIQESVSASADGLTFGVAALITAFAFWSCEKPRFTGKTYAVLGLLAVCVATFKVMYFPLLALLLAIPYACFGSKGQKRRALAVTFLAAFGVLGGWGLLCGAVYGGQSSSQTAVNVLPQIEYVLQNPLRLLSVLARTCKTFSRDYIQQIIGISLSWFNIPISERVVQGVAIVWIWAFVMQAACKRRPDSSSVAVMQGVCLGGSLLSLLVIFLFLYVWWTPYGGDIVQGIQGRYFLPLLYPLAMCMTANRAESITPPRIFKASANTLRARYRRVGPCSLQHRSLTV